MSPRPPDLRRTLGVRSWGRVTRLAWPATVTGFIRVSMRTVDLLVVARVVGAVGVAAVGVADAVARLALRVAQGLAAGTVALVSQHTGRGDRSGAAEAMTQSLVLIALVSVPFTIVGLVTARPLFGLLGAGADVTEQGVPYLRIVLLSAPLRMVAIVSSRAMQAAEDTRTPMVIRTAATLLNVAITVVLVPGLLGAPALGVVGAAWGTAIGNVVSGLTFVGVLSSGRFSVRLARLRWRPRILRRMLTIGLPQVAERLAVAVADIPLNGILLAFGADANAGFQIGRRIQQYLRMPSRGFAAAAPALVGTRLGADQDTAADRHARGALSLSVLVSAVATILVLLLARPLATLFVDETATLALATTWIRLMAATVVLQGAFMVLRAAFEGAGDTRPALLATVVGIVAGRLGTSWLVGVILTGALGGVLAGVALDHLLRTALMSRAYRRGTWRTGVPRPLGPASSW